MDKRQPLLIVEDDPALLKQIKWSLSQYDCVLASDQEQALAQLRRHEPAVVTMVAGEQALQAKDYAGAVQQYDAALRNDPNNVVILNNLA